MKRSSFLKSLLGIAVAPKVALEAAETVVAATPIVPAIPVMGASMGLPMKCFVSSIDFMDSREVNPDIFNVPEGVEDYYKRIIKNSNT